MARSKYENIIVIGYGYVTGEVLKHVYEKSKAYSYSVSYIEHEPNDFDTVKAYCDNNGIVYYSITNKHELTEFFLDITLKTLIISASNNYIFTEELLSKSNITAINFHNALLPNYPGRNAPSWVIYNNEKTTGITWHYVTKDVDAGNIIIQKSIAIDEDVKAYELAGSLMKLAYSAFLECYDTVLSDEVNVIEQHLAGNRRLYKSSEVPGNALFKIEDDAKLIYRLLRSIDYGKSGIFPRPCVIIGDDKKEVIRYKLIERNKAKDDENFVVINYEDEMVLQIKIKS